MFLLFASLLWLFTFVPQCNINTENSKSMYEANKKWSEMKQTVKNLGFKMPRLVILDLIQSEVQNEKDQIVKDNVYCPMLLQKIECRIENLKMS